jgi:hypothetical protein
LLLNLLSKAKKIVVTPNTLTRLRRFACGQLDFAGGFGRQVSELFGPSV